MGLSKYYVVENWLTDSHSVSLCLHTKTFRWMDEECGAWDRRTTYVSGECGCSLLGMMNKRSSNSIGWECDSGVDWSGGETENGISHACVAGWMGVWDGCGSDRVQSVFSSDQNG